MDDKGSGNAADHDTPPDMTTQSPGKLYGPRSKPLSRKHVAHEDREHRHVDWVSTLRTTAEEVGLTWGENGSGNALEHDAAPEPMTLSRVKFDEPKSQPLPQTHNTNEDRENLHADGISSGSTTTQEVRFTSNTPTERELSSDSLQQSPAKRAAVNTSRADAVSLIKKHKNSTESLVNSWGSAERRRYQQANDGRLAAYWSTSTTSGRSKFPTKNINDTGSQAKQAGSPIVDRNYISRGDIRSKIMSTGESSSKSDGSTFIDPWDYSGTNIRRQQKQEHPAPYTINSNMHEGTGSAEFVSMDGGISIDETSYFTARDNLDDGMSLVEGTSKPSITGKSEEPAKQTTGHHDELTYEAKPSIHAERSDGGKSDIVSDSDDDSATTFSDETKDTSMDDCQCSYRSQAELKQLNATRQTRKHVCRICGHRKGIHRLNSKQKDRARNIMRRSKAANVARIERDERHDSDDEGIQTEGHEIKSTSSPLERSPRGSFLDKFAIAKMLRDLESRSDLFSRQRSTRKREGYFNDGVKANKRSPLSQQMKMMPKGITNMSTAFKTSFDAVGGDAVNDDTPRERNTKDEAEIKDQAPIGTFLYSQRDHDVPLAESNHFGFTHDDDDDDNTTVTRAYTNGDKRQDITSENEVGSSPGDTAKSISGSSITCSLRNYLSPDYSLLNYVSDGAMSGDKTQDSTSERKVCSTSGDIGKDLSGSSITCSLRNYLSSDYSLLNYISDGAMSGDKKMIGQLLKTVVTPYSGIIPVVSESNDSDAASHVDSSNEEYVGNWTCFQNDTNNTEVIKSKRDHPINEGCSTSTHIWSNDDDVLQSKRDRPVLDGRSTSTHIWSNDDDVLQSKLDHAVLDGRSTSTHIWSTNDDVVLSNRDQPVLDGRSTSTHIWSNDDDVLQSKRDEPVLEGRSTSAHIWSNDDNTHDIENESKVRPSPGDIGKAISGSSITCSLRNYSSLDYSLLNYVSDGAMSQSVNSFNICESVSRRHHDLSPDFSCHNVNCDDVLSHSVSGLSGAEVGRMSPRTIIGDTDFKGGNRLEDKAVSSLDVVKKTIHVSVGGKSRSERFSCTSQFQKSWIETILNRQVQNAHYPRNTNTLIPRVDTGAIVSVDETMSTLVNFIHAVCGNTTVNIWSDDSNSAPPRKTPIDGVHIQPEVSTHTGILLPSYGNRRTSCGDVRKSSIMTSTCDVTDTIPESDLTKGRSKESSTGKPIRKGYTDDAPSQTAHSIRDTTNMITPRLLSDESSLYSSRQNDIDSISFNQPEHGSTSWKETACSDSSENEFVVPLFLSRNPNWPMKPQDAAAVRVLCGKKPPPGTPMVTPCKYNIAVVNETETRDRPSQRLNTESKTDNRRTSTQSNASDAEFVYSRRDHTIPLAESSHRLFADGDMSNDYPRQTECKLGTPSRLERRFTSEQETIDDSSEDDSVDPSLMRGKRDALMRRHTVHDKMMPGRTTAMMSREENNAAVEETGASVCRRNTISTTEDGGRSKQSHPNVIEISNGRYHSRSGDSRLSYTPDTRRIRKQSDVDETLFLYSKRDHSIPLAESTHDRFSDYDNNVNTASSDITAAGQDDYLYKNVSDPNILNQMARRSTSSQESISDVSEIQIHNATILFQQGKGDATASAYGQQDKMTRQLDTLMTPYSGIIPVVTETNVSDAASHVDSPNEEYSGNRTWFQNDTNNTGVIQSKRDHPILDIRSTSTHIWSNDDDVLQSKRDHPVLDIRCTSTHVWSNDDDVLQSNRDHPVLDGRSTSTHIWSNDDDVLQSKRDHPVLDIRSTSTHIWSNDDDAALSKRDHPVLDDRSTSTHIWSNDDDVVLSKRDHPVLDDRSTSTPVWSSDGDAFLHKRGHPVLDDHSTSTHIWPNDDDTVLSKRDQPVLDDHSTSTHIWPNDGDTVLSKRNQPVLDDHSTSTHIWPNDDDAVISKRDHPVLDDHSTSTHIWPNVDDAVLSKRDQPVLDDHSTSTHIWPNDDDAVLSTRDHPVLDDHSTSTHIWPNVDDAVLSKRDQPVLDDRSTSTHIWPNDDDAVLSTRDHPVLDDHSTSAHIWPNVDDAVLSKRDQPVLDDRSTSTPVWSSDDDALLNKRDHPVLANHITSTHIWPNDDDSVLSKRDQPVLDDRSTSTHLWPNDDDTVLSTRDHPVLDDHSTTTHIWPNVDDAVLSKRDHPVLYDRSTSTYFWPNDDDTVISKRDQPVLDDRSTSTHIGPNDDDNVRIKLDHPVLDTRSTRTHIWSNDDDVLHSKRDHPVLDGRSTSTHIWSNDDVLLSKRDEPVVDISSGSTRNWSNYDDDGLQSKRDDPALDIRSTSTHIWSNDEDVRLSKSDHPILDDRSTSTHSLINAVNDRQSKSDHSTPGGRNTGVQSATNNVQLSYFECDNLMVAVAEASRTQLPSRGHDRKTVLTPGTELHMNTASIDYTRPKEFAADTLKQREHLSTTSHKTKSDSRVYYSNCRSLLPKSFDVQTEDLEQSNTIKTIPDIEFTPASNTLTTSSNLANHKSNADTSHVKLDHSEENKTSTSNKPSDIDALHSNQFIAFDESTHSTISKARNTIEPIPTHDIEAHVDNVPEHIVVTSFDDPTASRPDRTAIMGRSNNLTNKNADMDQHCGTMLPHDWHTDNERKTIVGVNPCPYNHTGTGGSVVRNLYDLTTVVRGNASRTLSALSHSSASSQSSRYGTEMYAHSSYSGSDVDDSASTPNSVSSGDLDMAPTSLEPIPEFPKVEQKGVMSEIGGKQEMRVSIGGVSSHQSSGALDEDVRNRLSALKRSTAGDKLNLKAKSATEYLGLYDEVTFKQSPSADTAGIVQTAGKCAQNPDVSNTICTYASDPVTVEVWRLPSHDPTDASTGDDVADIGTRLDISTSGNMAVLMNDLNPESTQDEIAESAERILHRMLEVSTCNFHFVFSIPDLSRHLGSPVKLFNFLLHHVLFVVFSCFSPAPIVYLQHASFHIRFGLPRLLFPVHVELHSVFKLIVLCSAT